tara:strand:- start:33653 stop:35164 length:1512 start_codon:yes stop_codon:yes gene_type:complete
MNYFFKHIPTIFSIVILAGYASSIKKGSTFLIQQDKPNLLFIFPDQLPNATIGINKQDPVITPNLDQLTIDGVVFSNAISTFPLCSPYRDMLMTGKLPHNNNLISNSNSSRDKYNNSWQKNDVSFFDVLVENGYDAGYIGKLHLTSPPPIAGKDSIIWDAYTPKEFRHKFNFWHSYGTFDEHNKPHYWINDAKKDELTYINEWPPKHEADVIIDYFKNASEKTRSKDKPFALFWSLKTPHPPYQDVPEKYLEAYKDKTLEDLLVRPNVDLNPDAKNLAFHKRATKSRANEAKKHVKNYFAMVTGVDDQIGRVLKALKAQGLAKNTIVVITTDHGEMMGSHGLMSKNIWYEESINIPFIIRWPEKIKGGLKYDLLLGPTNVMPTILNMLGATKGIPSNLDEEDLSSIILKNEGTQPSSVLYYYIEEGQPASGHRGIRTKTHTYVIALDTQNIERVFLYDNRKNPYQISNLAGKDTALENMLKEQLQQQLKEKNNPRLAHYQSIN